MKMITVNVTQQHIDDGERMECKTCPIALALNEQHPMPKPWRVGNTTSRWREETPFGWCRLPLAAQTFIGDFDFQRPVQPFTFEMEVPE
jgi:hypothetical protein